MRLRLDLKRELLYADIEQCIDEIVVARGHDVNVEDQVCLAAQMRNRLNA